MELNWVRWSVVGTISNPIFYWLHGGKWLPSRASSGAWYRDPNVRLYWINSFCTMNPGAGPFFGSATPMHPQFVFVDGTTGWSPAGDPAIRVPRSYRDGGDLNFACNSVGPDPVSILAAVGPRCPPCPRGRSLSVKLETTPALPAPASRPPALRSNSSPSGVGFDQVGPGGGAPPYRLDAQGHEAGSRSMLMASGFGPPTDPTRA